MIAFYIATESDVGLHPLRIVEIHFRPDQPDKLDIGILKRHLILSLEFFRLSEQVSSKESDVKSWKTSTNTLVKNLINASNRRSMSLYELETYKL